MRMFLMRADTLRGQVGGGGPGNREFLGPVKWRRADRRVPIGAQKTRDFQGPTPSYLPKYAQVMDLAASKHIMRRDV